MFDSLIQYSAYLQYSAPPLIGAFIGYLTNKIAIRMLFRPLRAIHIFGIKLPFTPGIIPSKRHLLAENIGEMVRSHLLTSHEISKGLAKPAFQHQLGSLIKNRTGAILDKDLDSLPAIIPRQYNHYFDIALKTISYKIKESLHNYIASQQFEKLGKQTILQSFDSVLERDIDSFLTRGKRFVLYEVMDRFIKKILSSSSMEQWVEDFLYSQMSDVLKKKKSIQQILPESLTRALLEIVEAKTPDILIKLADLAKDPDIQQRIVMGIKKGVDSFSASLGPMGGMVQNFLNIETIETAVKNYLENNEEEITAWLNDENVQARVAETLLDRVNHYLNTPIVNFIPKDVELKTNEICRKLSVQLTLLLKEEGVARTISTMLKENIEVYIDGGSLQAKKVLDDVAGREGVQKTREWVAHELITAIRSAGTKEMVNKVIDQLFIALVNKPLGKLSNFLPAGIRDALYSSMQKISSEMLATEVPGLFASLNIQNIVTEKVDSLDLLRLERLLLSIMEEQFKYINLFGALLGFLIGSLNVLILYFL
jgi:uncharacterized membrane protein YheB (UPF0754 family)